MEILIADMKKLLNYFKQFMKSEFDWFVGIIWCKK